MLQTKFIKVSTHKHILYTIIFPENPAVYEIMWENMVQPDRP